VIRNALIRHLADLDQLDAAQLLEQRFERLAGFGHYKEG
jgi:acetyl-CoA carboxylase alpha subunit